MAKDKFLDAADLPDRDAAARPEAAAPPPPPADPAKADSAPIRDDGPSRADYDQARDKLGELLGRNEADQAKVKASAEKRAGAERVAKMLGMPFDPSSADPLYVGDPALQLALHKQHYAVADIEKALGISQMGPAPAPSLSARP